MDLTGDDRARVPFALVGVVLLVGSATFAASVHTGPRDRADPPTERSLERARSEAVGALRAATRTAAERAMRTPVVVPANSSAGRALDEPFQDALALRIRDRLEARLATVSVTEADTVATARLERARSVDARLASIDLRRAGANGSALGVRTTVVLEARRGSDVVDRVRRTLSVVVGTPVLAVHDRVERFERALAAGPTRFGLARQVTAQLYAVAWARGYAQYGGAPVANVVATRHLELATNRGLLSLQRTTLGCPGRGAVSALRKATARTAATDLGVGVGVPDGVAKFGARGVESATRVAPEDTTTVEVGRPADRGLRAVRENLSRVLNRTYSAEVRLVAATSRVSSSAPRDPPGQGWEAGERHVEYTVTSATGTPRVTVPAGYHRLRTYERRVERRVVREWTRGDERTTTTGRIVDRVRVGVVGRHAPSRHAPRRGIASVHEPGGPLNGPNLAGIEDRAVERLVAGRGGPDEVAGLAAAGRLESEPVVVHGRRPSGLRRWVTEDLVALHERVRGTSVSVSRGDLGTYRANPPARLADAIASRRTALLDAPTPYPSVAAKARVAARGAYLAAVRAALERRAENRRSTRSHVDDALADGGSSLHSLAAAMDARRHARSHDCRPIVDDIAGSREVVVDAAPAYLTTGAVERREVGLVGAGRFRPLATRNLNLFTVPREEVSSGAVSALLGEKTVQLRSAAATLRAAGELQSVRPNRTLDRRRARLEQAVAAGVAAVRDRMRAELRRAGVDRRRAILEAALGRWNTTAGRAIAIVDGNATEAVVAAAVSRDGSIDATRRALLASRLRVSVAAMLRSAATQPKREVVADAARISRRLGRVALETGVGEALDRTVVRRLRTRLGAVPAGLPVAPVPGYWYATTNFWTVEAEGRYERLVVRVRQGGPVAPLRYVRDGRTARFDADGDGRPERVGRAARIDFALRTGIVVVVPAGPRGVGDVGGDRDERSPGWGR